MRIVSLVPSHTETLHELGLADAVVGRTRFCVHPSGWVEGVPHVGGTKDAKLAKIVALRPDVVVADKDENPKALVDALVEKGVEVLWSEIDSIDDVCRFLLHLGARFGAEQAAKKAVADIEAARPTARHRIPVFCPIWHAPWMTFDATAYPHAMLAAVGLDNVFGKGPGPKYFEVTAGEPDARGAAWTLLPTEPFPFHKQPADLAALGRAGRRHRIIDGEALTWFGTRTAEGLRSLAGTASSMAAEGDDQGE